MIECFEGTLGGGKSYHATLRALKYLAVGGRVFSNIELVRSECESFVSDRYGLQLQWDEQYRFLSASDISRLHEVVKGGNKDCPVLCILDEIHLYHNSRDWAQASRGLLQWLTQSRKLFVDIICITQHRNNLDKQWVRLMGKYWRFRDLRKWRMPGIGLRIPFAQCLSVELDQDGKTVLNKSFERFDMRVFRCYCSEQIFDGCASGFAGSGLARLELKKKEAPKMKGYIWIIVMLFAIAGLVFFGIRSHKSSSSLFGQPSESPKPSPVERMGVPKPVDVPRDDFSPWVRCDGWTAKDTYIISAYCSSRRLLFRGPPDRIDDGEPVYHVRRGVPAW